ncbi:Rad52/22 family double-strand break repair protein-domain-containing protein [Lipomyces japonicus]|uniref:Rad52/22 family double-strand break repair protein-domain-containing protein n=1 Tax=Lipomyces japonicus TaxID=56871 RepID=UPI0034D00F94
MPFEGDQHRGAAGQWNPFLESQRQVSSWSEERVQELQAKLDRHLGPEFISSRAGPGGKSISYISGATVINIANDVFGFNGWSTEIKSVTVNFVDENRDGRVNMSVSVIMRITLRDGTFHEDVGNGHLENAKSKAMAFEKCKKQATTDAMKRALRRFGNATGNCLYDQSYLNQVAKIKYDQKSSILDPSRLITAQELSSSLAGAKRQRAKTDEVLPRQPPSTTSTAKAPNLPTIPNLPTKGPVVATTRTMTTATTATTGLLDYSRNELEEDTGANELYGSDIFDEYKDLDDELCIESDDFDIELDIEEPNVLERRSASYGNTDARVPLLRTSNVQSNNNNNNNTIANSTAGNNTPSAPVKVKEVSTPINGSNPVLFVSARAAEKVQNDEPLDEKAMFDVHFQSPSIRKTVDHTKSRPIHRTSVMASSAVNFDNPQLNSTRAVGMPPGLSRSPSSRPLLSVGQQSGLKRMLSINGNGPRPEPFQESTNIVNNGGNDHDINKKQKF